MCFPRNQLSLYLLFLAAISCKENPQKDAPRSERIQTSSSIQLIRIERPQNGTTFSQGETIEISFRKLSDSTQIDSAILFLDSKRISSIDENLHSLSTKDFQLGSRQLRVTAWYNGNRQTASVGIRIKSSEPPKKLTYRVINTYPHDIDAYTQGLFFHKGQLIESTGQKGSSSLRRVDYRTGKVLQSVNLDRQYFGEGATYYNGEIYQLTWTSRKGFVYDPETFTLKRSFDYITQGWGLTTKGDTLIMSDGSNILYFLEPRSFSELKRIEVYDNNGPVTQLNELELINGMVFANIYQTDKVAIINPYSGKVEAEVDFSGLLSDTDKHRNIDVLNGIAWDSEGERLFVTGKNWPKLFHVKIF